MITFLDHWSKQETWRIDYLRLDDGDSHISGIAATLLLRSGPGQVSNISTSSDDNVPNNDPGSVQSSQF